MMRAERFVELVEAGHFDDTPLYRAVPGFLVQFGLNATERRHWGTIRDDGPGAPSQFQRGMLSFAGSGQHSRSTEMFISFGNAASLGKMPWETPFGVVSADTLQAVDSIN